MKSHHAISFTPYYHHSKTYKLPNLIPSCGNLSLIDTTVCFKSKMSPFSITHQLGWQQSQYRRFPEVEKSKRTRFFTVSLKEDSVQISKKKGSVAGAIALVIGTSVGSGILALPKKTSPAGLIPSSISMTICWAFLLIEALLLVEINVGLLKKKKIKVDGDELEVISITTMAQETLGEWGGALATMTYVFLGYTSVIAYSAKSGEILYHLTNSPESVSGVFFTTLVTILITVGGTRSTDQVNQFLTASMIGLLIAIEVLAVLFGGWLGIDGNDGHWEKVPATLPVMIFALVYHDLAPVLCAYLEGDLIRIRASIILGSIMPLLALLVWNAIALGLSNQADQVADPVELLMSIRWSGVPLMVEAFSLLAVGTSLIGTLLSFLEFFKEQLNNLTLHSPSAQILEKSGPSYFISNWWKRNRINFTATVMIIAPSLLVSTMVPDAFSAATDFAGGYCMTMLYGVLPPLMALSMNKKQEQEQETEQTMFSNAGPALVGVGLCAFCLVVEQIIQDLSLLPNN